jgi:hypothetical protein
LYIKNKGKIVYRKGKLMPKERIHRENECQMRKFRHCSIFEGEGGMCLKCRNAEPSSDIID